MYFFFTYSQPKPSFVTNLYSIHRAICRPSDHSHPGPRFEPGTGGSSGGDTKHYRPLQLTINVAIYYPYTSLKNILCQKISLLRV